MNVIIRDVECIKNKCPFNVALFLAALYNGALRSAIVNKAVSAGYLTFDNSQSTTDCTKFILTEAGNNVIESIMLNSEVVEKKDGKDRFVILADKLRSLYPAGRKQGTAYQWRDSTAVISLRLKALVKKYPDYFENITDGQIINATKKYVNSFNGNYTYMQLLKYFIMKNNLADRAEDSSQLLSYIDNEGQEDTYNNDNGELV